MDKGVDVKNFLSILNYNEICKDEFCLKIHLYFKLYNIVNNFEKYIGNLIDKFKMFDNEINKPKNFDKLIEKILCFCLPEKCDIKWYKTLNFEYYFNLKSFNEMNISDKIKFSLLKILYRENREIMSNIYTFKKKQ